MLSHCFICCPVSLETVDSEWYHTLDEAKEDALKWSAELSGETVIVYEAFADDLGDFSLTELCEISA